SAGWPTVALAGGLAVGLAGVAVAAYGRGWEGLSSRYDSPASSTTASAASGGVPSVTAPALWDALDRGEDPTAERRPPATTLDG
ncbi:MAG: Trp biosynthesis-associated membrane protein, partial [Actinomycetota bacterium]|nr:Trp biosynthesis-associated membrane protein [Actinomycetota bacterium]